MQNASKIGIACEIQKECKGNLKSLNLSVIPSFLEVLKYNPGIFLSCV